MTQIVANCPKQHGSASSLAINTSLDGSNPQNPGPMHFIWDHRPSSQSLQTTNHIIIGYLRQTKHDMISPCKIMFG
jgi:hypothetical protein